MQEESKTRSRAEEGTESGSAAPTVGTVPTNGLSRPGGWACHQKLKALNSTGQEKVPSCVTSCDIEK